MPETFKKIYLLRHGSVPVKYIGKYIGRTDLSLCEIGVTEARQCADDFKNLLKDVEKVYLSPMLRCRQTFQEFSYLKDSNLEVLDNLKEIDFGDWEKHSFDDISKEYAELIDQWATDDSNFSFPNGESLEQFYYRVEQIYQHVLKDNFKSILIVAHGGVITHLIAKFLGMPNKYHRAFRVSYASLSSVDLYNEIGQLTKLNER